MSSPVLVLFLSALALASALLPRPAAACEGVPLEVRTVQPREGATDIPLDVRVAVSFIGLGEADEFEVELLHDDTEVPTVATSWCYEHEGPYEVHCWWSLKPVDPLGAGTTYRVRAISTPSWQGEGSRHHESSFTTGSSSLGALSGTPTLEIRDAWTESTGAEYDYDKARRYVLDLTAVDGTPDPSATSLFHLEELDEAGKSLDLVHSLYVSNPGEETVYPVEYKQFLDGSVERGDCFRVVQENGAGARSDSVVACWEPPDSGGSDSGGSDSGGSDSGGPDSGRSDGGSSDGGSSDGGSSDSGGSDSGGPDGGSADGGNADSGSDSGSDGGSDGGGGKGCGSRAGLVFPLVLLLGLRFSRARR